MGGLTCTISSTHTLTGKKIGLCPTWQSTSVTPLDLCYALCFYRALTFQLSIMLCALLSMMIPWYNIITPIRHRRLFKVYGVYVKVCKMVFDYLTPIPLLQN